MMQDGLGSVRSVVDNGSGVEWSGSPDPFGNYFGEAGTRQTPYGFTGEYTDPITGMVHLRARDYHPALGVFPALDPFEGIANRPMSLNGYSWVEGNVPNAVDPSGLQTDVITTTFPSLPDIAKQCGGNPYCLASLLGISVIAALIMLGLPTPAQQKAYQNTNDMLQFWRDYTGNPPTVGVPKKDYPYIDKWLNEDWSKLEPSWMRPPNGKGPDWWKLLGLGLGVSAPNLFRILVERICGGCFTSPQPTAEPVATPTFQPTPTATPNPCNPQRFQQWWNSFPPAPVTTLTGTDEDKEYDKYEDRVARGIGTMQSSRRIPAGGGETIDADGANPATCRLLEAKHATDIDNPPWRPNGFSQILNQADDEIRRYAGAINMAGSQASGLEIHTNSSVSQKYFSQRLTAYSFISNVTGFSVLTP